MDRRSFHAVRPLFFISFTSVASILNQHSSHSFLPSHVIPVPSLCPFDQALVPIIERNHDMARAQMNDGKKKTRRRNDGTKARGESDLPAAYVFSSNNISNCLFKNPTCGSTTSSRYASRSSRTILCIACSSSFRMSCFTVGSLREQS